MDDTRSRLESSSAVSPQKIGFCAAWQRQTKPSLDPSPLKISPFLGCVCPSLIGQRGPYGAGWLSLRPIAQNQIFISGAVQSCSIWVDEDEGEGGLWVCQAGSRPTAGPTSTPISPPTHLHTQSGCDKALSVTVVLGASGGYGKVKCIWRREAAIWSRSPSS